MQKPRVNEQYVGSKQSRPSAVSRKNDGRKPALLDNIWIVPKFGKVVVRVLNGHCIIGIVSTCLCDITDSFVLVG